MRLDKYLKVSRIIKRRTVAAAACDAGRVDINGKVAKSGDRLKIGDIIELRLGQEPRRFEVLALEESTRKEDAGLLFRQL